jgi:hypothetical protein
VAITVVGALDSSTGTAPTTLVLTAVAAVGDVRVFRHKVNSTTIAATALSGGNCASWTQVAGPTNDNQGTVGRHAIWIGTVANANTSQHETITITWSASITGISVDLDCQTFSNSNTATTWAKDGSASGLVNNTSSTTISYPSLTAAGTGELYVGYARASTGSGYGNPAGGTSRTDANGNPAIYLLNAGSGTVAPTQTSAATVSNCMGVLLIASAGPTTFTATLSVTGVGVVSLAKRDAKPAMSVTGVGSVTLRRQFNRPLSVTGVGVVPALAKNVQPVKAVTGVGTVSLAKFESKALKVVGVGSVTVAKLDGKLLVVTGVGVTPAVLRQFNRTLAVVGVGVVSGPTKLSTKILRVTGVGVPALAKLDAKLLGLVTGAGVVSITQVIVTPGRVAYVTLYDTGLYTVTMGDEGVAVVLLRDESVSADAPVDTAVATVRLTDTAFATVLLVDEHIHG